MSEAMSCPACGAARGPDDRFCIDCGAALPARDASATDAGHPVSDGAADRRRETLGHDRSSRPVGLLVAVAALVLLAVALGAAWLAARREATLLQSQKATLEQRVSRLMSDRASLARPLVTAARVFNGRLVEGRINVLQYDGPFEQEAVYQVGYIISGPNQSFGVDDVSGTIGVKYLAPDHTVFRNGQAGVGPFSFTGSLDIKKDQRTWQSYSSLGSNTSHVFQSGDWTIEWWWEGTKLGQSSFKINPSPFNWGGFRFPIR